MKNITTITGRNFQFKVNPHGEEILRSTSLWFKEFDVYDEERQEIFLTLGQFELFTAVTFPDIDLEHLETCLAFNLWAFAADDLFDEDGEFQTPDETVAGLNTLKYAFDLQGSLPDSPYAKMLRNLIERVQRTATQGTCVRLEQAFEKWADALIQQAKNRSTNRIPLINEFIAMRRKTIGVPLVEALVEYSLDLDIPASILQHPIVVAMSEAINDIMTWPNDLCSFNKEQADGDFSNLVCCIMAERKVELQEAVDLLTNMISDRVTEYIELKSQLPSFGAEVDEELGKYLQALEYYVQGTVVWYYKSPRYFRDFQVNLDHEQLDISLYPIRNSSHQVGTLDTYLVSEGGIWRWWAKVHVHWRKLKALLF